MVKTKIDMDVELDGYPESFGDENSKCEPLCRLTIHRGGAQAAAGTFTDVTKAGRSIDTAAGSLSPKLDSQFGLPAPVNQRALMMRY